MKDHTSLMLDILNGLREKPIPNTNVKFIELYQKCWKYETDDRPNIQQFFKKSEAVDDLYLPSDEIDEETPREWSFYLDSKYLTHACSNAIMLRQIDVAEQLGDRKVLPIEDIKILSELEYVSDFFWDKYKETPLSCVSSGMVDEKAVLVALVCLPKGTQVNLPGEFEGYRVLIDYGEIEPAHRKRHDELKPGISIGNVIDPNSDQTFTLGPVFRTEQDENKRYILTVEHGVRNSNLVIQPESSDQGMIPRDNCAEVMYTFYGVDEEGRFLDYAFARSTNEKYQYLVTFHLELKLLLKNINNPLKTIQIIRRKSSTLLRLRRLVGQHSIHMGLRVSLEKPLFYSSMEIVEILVLMEIRVHLFLITFGRLWGIFQGVYRNSNQAFVIPIHVILDHAEARTGKRFILV
ncbi:hypothetical protein C1646_664702 [Rhizophagus diaphanus]|nr:hypothetical protein C1646_664702 [Rhizophagus diaphanus] [Rhizophagus sp. MUCL 43196]